MKGDRPLVYGIEIKGLKSVKGHIFELKKGNKTSSFGVPYKNTYSKGVIHFNGVNYRLLLSKDKKTRSLIQRIITFNDNGESKDLLEEHTLEYKDYDDFPSVYMAPSRDSSYLYIVKAVDENKKNKDLKLYIELFDSKFKKLYSKSWTPKVSDSQRMVNLEDYALDNSGNVYILVKKYRDKYKESVKKGKKSVSNYDLMILKYDVNGNLSKFSLENNGQFSYGANLFLFEDDTPMVISRIATSGYEDASITGLQYFLWNPEKKSFETKDYFWSDSELSEFGNWKKQKHPGLRKYFYSVAYQAHNDKITFLLENIWSADRRSFHEKYRVIRHGCILSYTVDKKGNKIDHLFIPRLVENGIRLQPPILHIIDDKPYILYNDDIKNFNLSITKLRDRLLRLRNQMQVGDFVVGLAYKDGDGKLTIDEIADTRKHMIFSEKSIKLSDHKYGAVTKHIRSILQKPVIKYCTFDFSEFVNN